MLINSNTLKIIAIISMLIDHTGVIILEPLYGEDSTIYILSRMIGRLAFPIFCFLLVQGYKRTKNIYKYLTRIFIFALISEPIFNISFNNCIIDFGLHNVLFTLLLGLLSLYIYDKINYYILLNKEKYNNIHILLRLSTVFVFIAFSLISYILDTDYSYLGIILIGLMYLSTNLLLICLYILYFCNIPAAIISGFLFHFMSDTNKKQNKYMQYFFYAFYPAHLLLLVLIKRFILNI